MADEHPNSKVLTVSPGMVNTGLWRNFPTWFQAVTYPIRRVALRTPDDAASGVVFACAAEEIEGVASGAFMVDGVVEECSERGRDLPLSRAVVGACDSLIDTQ